MGKGPEQTLLHGGHTDVPEIYERMLNITSHQRMQTKTTVNTISSWSEWPSKTNPV